MKIACRIIDVGMLFYWVDLSGCGYLCVAKSMFKYEHKIGDIVEINLKE